MIPYLYAKELKKKYIVYGSFYNITYRKESLSCRNLLEIYDRSHFATSKFTNNINNLLPTTSIQPLLKAQHQGIPDAIFIMMNPGSSKPLQENYTIPNFLNNTQLPRRIQTNPLVVTQPDNAQYQIMNVMDYKKWKHVRIINLSDLRETKSLVFMKKVALLTNDIHAIFSKERTAELKAALTIQSIPIFAAWGCDEKLIPLATKCLSALPDTHRPKGVQCSEDDFRLYAHASPSFKKYKIKWLELIQKVVDG